MKRIALLLTVLTGALLARWHRELPAIAELDACIQSRFLDTRSFGMSRLVMPFSLGDHFRPNYSAVRDFQPENQRETELLAKLEAEGWQIGLYLFGENAVNAPVERMDYRALKGPGVITKGTPRPMSRGPWDRSTAPSPGFSRLPDWATTYPVAQKAMKRFLEDGEAYQTHLGDWTLIAQPVRASKQECLDCHNSGLASKMSKPVLPGFALSPSRMPLGTPRPPSRVLEHNDVIGGVIYAFRAKM